MINFNGKSYSCYSEIAIDYSIPYDTFMARVRRGWTLEQATELVPRKKPKEKKVYKNAITINNVTYKSQAEAMKKLNLNRYQLKRLIELGSTDSLRSNKITVIINNEEKTFKSVRQFCKEFNLIYANFCIAYREDKSVAQKEVDKFYQNK